MSVKAYKDSDILGTRFTHASIDDVKDAIIAASNEGRKLLVTFRNPHYVMAARRDPALNELLDEFDFILPDGWGVVLASRMLHNPLPGQVSAEDLLETLDQVGRMSQRPVVAVGGPPEVSNMFGARLRTWGFKASLVVMHGFDDLFSDEMRDRLLDLRPCVLIASLGAPLQERWLAWANAFLPAAIGITAGGMVEKLARHGFDPPAFRRLHLGWLYLSARSPRRFRERYLLGIPRFLVAVHRARVSHAEPAREK